MSSETTPPPLPAHAETATRPLRADARRNRERIVAAAREAFAETGLETQMDDVARRAGVGVGTVYRHFPTKDALVRALIVDKMAVMAEKARAAVAADAASPWDAFADFIRDRAEDHASDRALSQVMSTQPSETFLAAARETGLWEAVGALLERARAAGQVRPDAGPQDVATMMCGLSAVLQSFDVEAGRRYLELMLEGLRGPGAPRE
jgi:AcrR family transcriptional regulator